MPSQSADIVKTHCLFIGSFACFDLVTSSSYERRSTAKITPINPPANKPHSENKKKFNHRQDVQVFTVSTSANVSKAKPLLHCGLEQTAGGEMFGMVGGSRAEEGLAGLQL